MEKKRERCLNVADDTIKSVSKKPKTEQDHNKEKIASKGLSSKDFQESISNQTHVSTTLTAHLLSKKFPDSNVVFSPFSLHVILSILVVGSKGQTHEQLLTFLKANNSFDLNSLYAWLAPLIFADGRPIGGPRLSIANAVWVDKTLSPKPSFKEVVDTTYKATCKQVNFMEADEVANKVNLWADKQTNGIIKKVLDASLIDRLTRLILTNAIYFKGEWTEEFNKSRTQRLNFHLLNGTKVKVPFMTSNESQLVCEYNDFKVLGLPYFQGQDNRQFTMYFFLPNTNDGLSSLVEKISSTSDFLDRHIPRRKVRVGKFFIPKFKICIKFEATEMLKELGLVLPFKDVADFTEMVGEERLNVKGIHQKSYIEVNEKGTEAAVVSCGEVELCDFKDNSINFVADHPFFFAIIEDLSGVLLFTGHVINPSID